MDNRCVECNIIQCPINFLSAQDKEKVLDNVATVSYKKGETVRKQGTFTQHLIFIKEGYLKIYEESCNKALILRIVPPLNTVGINSLFGNKVSLYSVSAIEPTEVCLIGSNIIVEYILSNSDATKEIFSKLYACEKEIFQRFSSLTQKQLHGRLADAILYLSEHVYKSKEFNFFLTRKDLAELTSMSTESAIKIFKEFQNDNLILLEKNKLKILSIDLLRRISEIG